MKRLTILLRDQGTALHTGKQMREIFGEVARVKVVIAGPMVAEGSVDADLVVISRQMEELIRYVRPGTRVLVADRAVNPDQVRRLFALPADSDVLVVNTTRELTEEAIEQMELYEVEGLRYHPYYPGIREYRKNCPYAITFGEMDAVPPGEYRSVTDLHSRLLSMEACVLIARELGLYEQLRGTLTAGNIRPMIRLTQDLAKLHIKYAHTSEDLQKIIALMEDGVLVLDQQMRPIFINPMAEKMLGSGEGRLRALVEELRAHGEDPHFFHRTGSDSYYVERISSSGGRERTTIVMLRDVKKIERIENSYRRALTEKGLAAKYEFKDIIYRSAAMGELIQTAREFARGESTVFLHGESGSGKELLAQAIHNASPRRNGAFVAVNFASISLSLSESELFGYADGAFTGARRGGRKGLFELAHKGTIFLDEIGDAPLELQKKLLRVIQERKVLPVGGSKLIPVDVRIIAASNQDMGALVERREFREDLYYRLNVLPLYLPPLRRRREDILPLFSHFLKEFRVDGGELSRQVRTEIEDYPWPGNVRELRNVAEYVSNFARFDPNWPDRLPGVLHPLSHSDGAREAQEGQGTQEAQQETDDPRSVRAVLELLDRPPYRFSRQVLTRELAEEYGLSLSESQVKGLVGRLKDRGLVNAVTGRGTFLQAAGQELLRRWRAREKQL
ncbi:sigma 54-interacting transcriptional regulator [Oscillibacter sp. MSJ-2]|uniref:Sigma 54-interacting transcriptional regulator n=1 Tax=Dysosmobacter acutus TaxID=2841504 RepID=A0ABS6F881_9FIRM|nr:sigma 54-interacting transcriptional regulator [Dysosmobacter acutus]MBU5625570.1 sigma 54-interacting transcriptional regulator [Dysosmobacter acutus]